MRIPAKTHSEPRLPSWRLEMKGTVEQDKEALWETEEMRFWSKTNMDTLKQG